MNNDRAAFLATVVPVVIGFGTGLVPLVDAAFELGLGIWRFVPFTLVMCAAAVLFFGPWLFRRRDHQSQDAHARSRFSA